MTEPIQYTTDDGSTRDLIGFAENYPTHDYTSSIAPLMNPFGIASGLLTAAHDIGHFAAGNMAENVAIVRITDPNGQQEFTAMREENITWILEQENPSADEKAFASSALELLQKSQETDIDPLSGQEMQKINNLDASKFKDPNEEISLQTPTQSEAVPADTAPIMGTTLN